MKKLINQLMVMLFSIPYIKNRWAKSYEAIRFDRVPWTPLKKPLSECKMSLVTTGGIHLKTDIPFNMTDPAGDCTYRSIPSNVTPEDLCITHKYYNHIDADKDPNLILPFEILRQFHKEKKIGSIADQFFSFMGHIEEAQLSGLIKETSKEVAIELKRQQVDIVLLVPA